MNAQEKELFDAVCRHRAGLATALEDFALRGVKTSVVEKYSDQAHFIYELLQNADDAKATSTRFVLEPDRLIFAHNGTRHFSVSDPATEKIDSERGILGDINSITSVGSSNKTEASIGKFGVGFKAVFQYTKTPHIYDPGFRFKIERFIVPTPLDEDFPGRREDETLFVFPFNHPERNAEESCLDISEKLSRLSYPLLFLTNLKELHFIFLNIPGMPETSPGKYGKTIRETRIFDKGKACETIGEQISLSQDNTDGSTSEKNLWLFSRTHKEGHRYSVGFFLDENEHLTGVDEPAFCFFPTKKVTGLKFIIHAPFKLTDSREGIRAGVPHNNTMIGCLSNLSASSLVYLRVISEETKTRLYDDKIIDIIPTERQCFSDIDDRSQISFLPFYERIQDKLKSERLLPTKDGFVVGKNAYWASVTRIPEMFDDKQLGAITSNPEAKWVFTSLGRDEFMRTRRGDFDYIDRLIRTFITEEAIINGRSGLGFGVTQNLEPVRGISREFIEAQSFEWLHKFYGWLSETSGRFNMVRYKPIFIDQDRKAAAAFDDSTDYRTLFLPVDGVSGYRVVHDELLKNENTRDFINRIGIKAPTLKDQIFSKILPLYEDTNITMEENDKYFMIFFNYYQECDYTDRKDFIDCMKKVPFLRCSCQSTTEQELATADALYFPSERILPFLKVMGDGRLIDLQYYESLIGDDKKQILHQYLDSLGIKTELTFINTFVDRERTQELQPYLSRKNLVCSETNLEACTEILISILSNDDLDLSISLWDYLCDVIERSGCDLGDKLVLRASFTYYGKWRNIEFPSHDAKTLRTLPWLFDVNGQTVVPSDTSLDKLHERYNTETISSSKLIEFLGIQNDNIPLNELEQDDNISFDSYWNLTEDQKKKVLLGETIEKYNISLEELDTLLSKWQESKRLLDSPPSFSNTLISDENEIQHNSNASTYSKPDTLSSSAVSPNKSIDNTPLNNDNPLYQYEDDSNFQDQDEYTPAPINYQQRIQRAQHRKDLEIDRINRLRTLQDQATSSLRYSFGWFTSLLDMEITSSNDDHANSKEISICFAKVEREPGTKRTLILKHPNRYIPNFMEDLSDIPLVLHIGDEKRTIAIEVANIVSYTLRVKIKADVDIGDIDFSLVTEATIDARSPVFLLKELRDRFIELQQNKQYSDDFDMQHNLCKNMEFVFGPPGTGKTTYLANNVLIPLMHNQQECRVLVLTPTNKSADVLTRKIMDSVPEDDYAQWLIRFGVTSDESIEQSRAYREKTLDIESFQRNITVTTIARFPYDYFITPSGKRLLHAMNWDYIVIDEASMIPIANIVLPLYMKTPNKFIIAGDPLQIEPIASIDLWKDENIYKMVKLNSFESPRTIPHEYKVVALNTQYRSVPEIGQIFSGFAYGGKLYHHRSSQSQRPLNLGNELRVNTLNIIKFPVSKYESIYRCKRLQQSSCYQIYSALFTFEYIRYLSSVLSRNNPGSLFKIGVIAPYRAQADMIDKLIASEKLPKEVDVQVGTIHSFQGDECDIIFAVFNTPPTISSSGQMFLNKRNIINVAISRARDYLFVVMPDDDTEGIGNLRLIEKVVYLMNRTGQCSTQKSPDLEQLMFNDSRYLENNTFSTTHQNVNVYSLPERFYEVRTEDSSVDIQIHRGKKE